MTISQEDKLQRRAIYLHEAGHVLVGFGCGYHIKRVWSDGRDGFTEAVEPMGLPKKLEPIRQSLNEGNITPSQHAELAFSVYESDLVYTVGGIAGESIELGRTTSLLRRSSDDIASFFTLMGVLSPKLSFNERMLFYRTKLTYCQDRAISLINMDIFYVRALADALEEKCELNETEIKDILSGKFS